MPSSPHLTSSYDDVLHIAEEIDLLVHAELVSPFKLDKARLYGLNRNSIPSLLGENENPYELLMETERPLKCHAACLVVTGWAAPFENEMGDDREPDCRPSEHPKRQRVRICVAIGEAMIVTVMRTSEKPEEVMAMSERGMGELPDVLEAWWNGGSD